MAGNLVQSIDNDGSHTSMSWGPVTFWVATKTSLPVAVTASANGRRVVIFQFTGLGQRGRAVPEGDAILTSSLAISRVPKAPPERAVPEGSEFLR